MESLLWIKNKRGQTIRLKANSAQLYYQSLRRRKNLILKPRQKGMTTWIDGDQLLDCIEKPTNAVVISHEKESTQRLFRRVKFFIDHMTIKPVVAIENKSEISFPKRGSYYYIGTAGQRAFGRGDTIDRAHLSEISFYPDMMKILNGISEAAEYGEINCETTANGSGDFKDLWELHSQVFRDSPSFFPCFRRVEVCWPDDGFFLFPHALFPPSSALFVRVVRCQFLGDLAYSHEAEAFKLYHGGWL